MFLRKQNRDAERKRKGCQMDSREKAPIGASEIYRETWDKTNISAGHTGKLTAARFGKSLPRCGTGGRKDLSRCHEKGREEGRAAGFILTSTEMTWGTARKNSGSDLSDWEKSRY